MENGKENEKKQEAEKERKFENEHDKLIADNTEVIGDMLKYIRELRNHFEPIFGMAERFPEKWRKIIRLCRVLVTIGVAVPVLFKGGSWYYNKQKLHHMAERYAHVAQQMYFKENNPDVALPFLDKALELENESPEFIFQRAYMKGMSAVQKLANLKRPFNREELDLAHSAYAEALFLQELKPKRPEPLILQAQLLAVLKEKDRARKAIEKAIELSPDNGFAHLRMAMMEIDDKDFENAEKSLEKSLKKNPNSKWVWLLKGDIAMNHKHDLRTAREYYEKALEIDPKFTEAYYKHGWTFSIGKDKDYNKAREEMKAALAVTPDYTDACQAIGMFYGFEGNYTIAKIWMDKAIALDANAINAHRNRGVYCGKLGEYEEAVESFNKAILLDPMKADLYMNRAEMYGKLGKEKQEYQDMRFAYELNPKSTRILMYLGDFQLKIGDSAGALKFYDEAIAIEPRNIDALSHKAAALDAMNKRDEALAAIEEVLKVAKFKSERYWLQKGNLLQKYGKTAEALEAFVQARTLNTKLSEAWRKEADLQKGKNNTAYKEALSKYLELNPLDKAARAELDKASAQ